MADWTIDDVKLWLVQINLRESTADQFHEVDGKALQRFTEEDLVSRFDLRKGELRNILYSKRDRLQKEPVAPPGKKVERKNISAIFCLYKRILLKLSENVTTVICLYFTYLPHHAKLQVLTIIFSCKIYVIYYIFFPYKYDAQLFCESIN